MTPNSVGGSASASLPDAIDIDVSGESLRLAVSGSAIEFNTFGSRSLFAARARVPRQPGIAWPTAGVEPARPRLRAPDCPPRSVTRALPPIPGSREGVLRDRRRRSARRSTTAPPVERRYRDRSTGECGRQHAQRLQSVAIAVVRHGHLQPPLTKYLFHRKVRSYQSQFDVAFRNRERVTLTRRLPQASTE